MIDIIKLSEVPRDQKELIQSQVEEIFFLSSSLKSFSSEERRAAFYKRWCGDYQTLYPEEFFIAVESGNKVLGYLSGCSDSIRAMNEVSVPGFAVFHELFPLFPAHLHINFHPDARGKGLGSLLVNHYINVLKLNNVMGVHLVTSPDAKNVSFYERLGFNKTETKKFNEVDLYFMGCVLIPEF